MLSRIAHLLTRKPKLIVTIALLLVIPAVLGFLITPVNYDILSYLPDELDSSVGQTYLEDIFHAAATTMLVVEDMPLSYSEDLQKKVEAVEGVHSVAWLPSLMDISVPPSIYPDELREMFFSEKSTMMIVQYDEAGASARTMAAIDEVRRLCNESCHLAGISTLLRDMRILLDREMPFYILTAVVLALVALWLTVQEWVLPLTFLVSIALAIIYNFGTNFMMGEISYITKAIAAILQLGVTIDYSIFLFHRYQEEKEQCTDKRDAMANAVQSAFLSLTSSSLTTVAGFLALCFMQLELGADIGFVMAKGVAIGVATVILVLPSMVLLFDEWISRWSHRNLLPDFAPMNRYIIHRSKRFVALFLLLFLPAFYCQNHTQVYYKIDESLPQTLPSIVALNTLKDEFGMATTHFVVIDDTLPPVQVAQLLDEIEALDGISSVAAYNRMMGIAIPDLLIPEEILEICKKDGKQLMMINSDYGPATDALHSQLVSLDGLLKSYDPTAVITGEGALTDDLIKLSAIDFKVTNYLSIAAIFIIVAWVFRSLTISFVLVSTIELAIFINMGIPFLTGTIIPFISPTVIGCIQLGATVDYAILMTTRFREELQCGKSRLEAITIAANTSDASILTSSLVLFCATLGVGLISQIEMISSICLMLARGSLISAFVSIFILPSSLYLFEPLFAKTSLHWRTAAPAKQKV